MSNRFHALTVALEEPIRDDDAAALIAAIQQLRGVANVTPHVADHTAYMAMESARQEVRAKLWKVLNDG